MGTEDPAGSLEIMAPGVKMDHLTVAGADVDDIAVEPETLREAGRLLTGILTRSCPISLP